MLRLFQDPNLSLPATGLSPKRFLVPLKGGNKVSSLYLGDPYTSSVASAASSGASTIVLTETSEFLDSGTANVNGVLITYTGKTNTTLTGVSGLTTNLLVGDVITPNVVWIARGNVALYSVGADLNQNLQVRMKAAENLNYNFSGAPLILEGSQIAMGPGNASQIDILVQVSPGDQAEFTSWSIITGSFYKRNAANITSIGSTENGWIVEAPGYVLRRDQGLPQRLRVLSVDREVKDNEPGFIVGKYRWRDESTRNAIAITTTQWDIKPEDVGAEKFIAGIGYGDDLEPIDAEQSVDSIFARIRHGHYFTGAKGYYLPSGVQLEFAPANDQSTVYLLQAVPRETRPIFVGTWSLDSQRFYEKEVEYRQISALTNPDGTPRTDLPAYYFTYNRAENIITLNRPLLPRTLFLGTISGEPVDYLDMPVYPVDSIRRVYVDQGVNNPPIEITNYVYSPGDGTLQVVSPTLSGISVPGALVGQPIYADCDPAVAILYETQTDDTLLVDKADLNPAFAGIARGYLYLQHKRHKPAQLTLACDKPQIDIPATQSSIIGLIAYGPVYYQEDYALIVATAYSDVPGEIVPNATLQVIVDSSFSGLINYQDPKTQNVQVRTGGDGTANLIYTPQAGVGWYVPNWPTPGGGLAGLATTTLSNDTLILPEAVPVDQIYNTQEGWLLTTYLVKNNDPLLGMLGGDASLGEVAWHTIGIPGETSFATNGERDPWRVGTALIRPAAGYDAAGHAIGASGFDGTVKKLVYSQSIPTDNTIGAYFLVFIQRITLQLQALGTDVLSNSVMLEMDTQPLINENPWLILNDATQGLLNQYRLGWVPPNRQGPNL